MTKLVSKPLFILTLLLFMATAIAAADPEKPGNFRTKTLTVDEIVQRHIAAHGGEKALREGQTFWFTVTRDWEGVKTMKTVYQTRPDMMRTDAHTAKGQLSFAYDGKVAWRKRGIDLALILSPEETQQMKAHLEFDGIELAAGPLFAPLQLLEYAKKGTTVKLLGTRKEAGAAALELELKYSGGEIERYFIDAKSFLLVRRDQTYEQNGKSVHDSYHYGDYKEVAGRMFNHTFEYASDGKVLWKSIVSNISYDKPIDVTVYAMPK